MDEATLLNHRHLWVKEEKPHPSSELPLLTDGKKFLQFDKSQHIGAKHPPRARTHLLGDGLAGYRAILGY
ncbi:MAG: hypothetical protein FWG66_07250 [Spirochaetes bacterium]|nr:hypothetical protein [Spirochaetota bacterium]